MHGVDHGGDSAVAVMADQSLALARVRHRSSRFAVGTSIVPGLGQLYNFEPRKAAFFFLGTVLSIGPAVILIMVGEQLGRHLLDQHSGAGFLAVAFGSILAFLVLFVFGLYVWGSAVVDASRTARRLSRGEPEGAGRWLWKW